MTDCRGCTLIAQGTMPWTKVRDEGGGMVAK